MPAAFKVYLNAYEASWVERVVTTSIAINNSL